VAKALRSAGILMYRWREGRPEVLLAHPGGPYWVKRDVGAWTIPKGAIEEGEEPIDAARREFREEIGFDAPGEAIPLTPLRQPSRKMVHAWAVEGDCDAAAIDSNRFEVEWPPRSGRMGSYPEVDRAGWFTLAEARVKLLPGQVPFVNELEALLAKRV
jgi:predicted NUDIX family NTP pyrophosphohydrolase